MRIAFGLLLGVGLLAMSACDKKGKAPATDGSANVCSANLDCKPGWVCLGGRCADARAGAIYVNTDNAVRPSQVKAEVENVQQQHTAGVDKAMKAPE